MNRRWLVNRTSSEFVDYISRGASVSSLFARVLVNRGIKTVSSVRDFLTPGVSRLSDPFTLPGMAAAVERIKRAAAARERVLVHGDYDTDGLTSAVIMIETLRKVGLEVDCFIPNRILHGYGFSTVSVDEARKGGIKLVVTVDCGITSFDAAACARRAGIDVIITDHHEPVRRVKSEESGVSGKISDSEDEFVLPEAVAIVNPKISSFSSRLTPEASLLDVLSGAGVAFEVARALAADGTLPFSADDALSLLDLAALGTLADVVPLRGENRHILKEGMARLHEAERPGIRALKEVCGLDKKRLKAGLLAFSMVPRINAAGRIADAAEVVRLLLSADYTEASGISSRLDSLNAQRQRIEEEVCRQALSRLADRGADAVIVLSGEGWHEGVLGIVASRLVEKFYRPAFIFTVEEGVAKGSARSIPAFDICAGLAGCRELLLAYGGHKQAAGVRLKAENIPLFEEAISEIVRRSVSEDDFVPSLQIDAGVELREITHSLVRELEMLEPVGCGNAEPLFGSKGLDVISPKTVGNNHLKMRLGKNGQSFDAIGFNMSAMFENLGSPAGIDAVFVPSFNEWNGNKHLQLVLKDIRPGENM